MRGIARDFAAKIVRDDFGGRNDRLRFISEK